MSIKKFFSVFLAVIMLSVNVPVYAVSNVGVAAKSEYLKTEKRAFDELGRAFSKSELGKLLSFTQAIDSTYNAQMEVEVKMPDVKTRKYIVSENGTYLDRYDDGKIEAYVEGEKVATITFVANDNDVSIQIPELYEKYLTVDMTDLEGLLKKFDENIDTSTLPKGMIYNADLIKALKLDKTEEKIVEKAVKKYSKLLDNELLKNNYFEKAAQETINVNDSNYKCKVVSYKISTKDLLEGFEKVWKEFKNDTELINLIGSKMKTFYEVNAMINPTEYTELPTKEQILGAVDTIIQELKKEMSGELYLKSTLYHQEGNLIRRDISVEMYGEEMDIFSLYTINNNKNEYYALVAGEAKIEDKVLKSKNETTHSILITSEKNDYDYVDGEFVATKSTETNSAKLVVKKLGNNKYNMELFFEGLDGRIGMNYSTNKATAKEFDVTMDFYVTAEDQSFEFNTRTKYIKDIKINKINTKNNEIRLNEKSKEELVNLWKENEEQILEKIEGKFGLAFYYDEIKKTTMELQDRMQARADNATGAQIGKAVRVWLTECQSDPSMVDYADDISSEYWTKYSDLTNIDWYVFTDYSTLDGYDYYVALNKDRNSREARIMVALSTNGYYLPLPVDVTEVSDEIEGPRVIYIEP